MTDLTTRAPTDGATARDVAAKFVVQTPPVFERVEDERRHRLERLAATCRIFGTKGFGDGLLGHITVRDPEHTDRLWVNPLGVSFRQMRVSDLVQVDHEGELTVGDRPANPVGLRLHTAVHMARPEVNAVCHAHSRFGRAWASLGRLLDPITQDACVFFEQQALIIEPRSVFTHEQAAAFAHAFGDKRVAIQQGHGLFTTGQTVDEAAWWFISMEAACDIQLMAEAAGTPEHWPDAQARGLAGALGSPMFGWSSFQPMWDDLIATDSSFLD